MIYIVADERDVVRLRTNYRKRRKCLSLPYQSHAALARALFLDYITRINRIRNQPEWYNALTNNCTTNIDVLAAAAQGIHPSWDWRILLNGHAGEMMYERGNLAVDLPYAELKTKALINPAAQVADQARIFPSAFVQAGQDSRICNPERPEKLFGPIYKSSRTGFVRARLQACRKRFTMTWALAPQKWPQRL